ncbi:phosphatase PAP2 family protein [Emticicia fontis]
MKENRAFLKRFVIPPLLFIISLGLFSIIAHEIVYEHEDWFDTTVFTFIKTYSSTSVIGFFKFLTFFGSGAFLFPAYIVLVVLLFYLRRRADAIHVSILAITSTLIIYSSKLFFARPRPDLPLFDKLDSYSFPSGHSMGSFVFVCILIRELWESALAVYWKWIISFFLLLTTFAVGISRIVLRYHYASDVVGGFCLGLAYVLFYFGMQKWMKQRRSI